MANDIVPFKKDWLSLKHSVADLPMPFSHDIFLLECHVAGTTHVDDVLVKTDEVWEGSELALRRDAGNEADELAIAVITAAGDRIGWVPRKHNPILARLMDGGKLLVAKVTHKSLDDHWLNMRIAISMRDV